MRLTDGDTTIKLDAAVVREVAEILPERQTLTSFVREAVTKDVRRRKLRAAALLYRETFELDPAEAAEMVEWESSSLATEVKPKPKRPARARKS